MLVAGALFGPHHSIIEHFMKSGHWLYAKAIADGTGIERTVVVLALNQMLEAGLVEIKSEIRKYRYLEPCETDVRARLGEAIYAQCKGVSFAHRSQTSPEPLQLSARRRQSSWRKRRRKRSKAGKRTSTK
jgi:DNA-binding IclR family transcriptional regulator